ncbi:MAG: hypothetical protein Q8880_02935, partial [Bacteroidota bacterium]|nr:hypothetical protein [Bacteroidota bacterium]
MENLPENIVKNIKKGFKILFDFIALLLKSGKFTWSCASKQISSKFKVSDLISAKVILLIANCILISSFSFGATKTLTSTGACNWSTATWTGGLPVAGDDVVIGPNATTTLTLDVDPPNLNSITIGGVNNRIIVFNVNGHTLNVTNGGTKTIAINCIATNIGRTTTFNIGSGNVTCGGITSNAANSGGTGNTNNLIISTGSLTVTGNISMTNNAYNFIDFTGAGSITVTGTLSTGTLDMTGVSATANIGGAGACFTATTFNCGTGTVIYNGAGAQTIGAFTYYNLTKSVGGTGSLAGTTTVGGTFNIAAGTFACGANDLILNGPVTTPIGGSFTLGANTVTYGGAGAQNIIPVDYNNLTKSGAGTALITDVTSVSGNLSIAAGALDLGTVINTFNVIGTTTIAGTLIFDNTTTKTVTLTGLLTGAGAINMSGGGLGHILNLPATGANTIGTLIAGSGTVNFNGGGAQTIPALPYYNLSYSGTNTGTLIANTSIGNNLVVNSGTLSGGGKTFTVTGTTTLYNAGAITVNSNAAVNTFTGLISLNNNSAWTSTAVTTAANLVIKGGITHAGSGTFNADAATFSTNPQTITLSSSGNINFGAASGSVSVGQNLTIIGSATGVFQYQGGTFTIASNMKVTNQTALPSFVNFDGTLDGGNASSTWFNDVGSYLTYSSITKPFSTAGTFTANANGNTVEYDGTSSQTIPAINYYNLTISQARGSNNVTFPNGGTIGVAGNFSTTATAVNYIVTGSTVNYNGTVAQNVAPITYNNLTYSGSGTGNLAGPATIGGTFTISNGTFACGNFDLTLNGTVTYTAGIFTTGTNTVTYGATVAQDIIPCIYSSLTKSGAAGTATLKGTTTVGGTFTISSGTFACGNFDLNLNNTVTYIGGTFTTGTNTVTYGATVAQDIISATYNNLTKSGAGGTATLKGPTTVNGTFTLAGGTFACGNFDLTLNNAVSYTAGTFSVGTNTVTYGATSAQDIITGTYSNLTKSGAGGTATLKGNSTIGGTFNVASGTFDCGNFDLNLNGPVTTPLGGIFTVGTNTVTYGSAGNQDIIPVTYNNLSRTNGGSANLIAATTINKILNFGANGGFIILNDYNLTLASPDSTIVTGTPSNTAMVVVNGLGYLYKNIGVVTAPATTSFTYPIGDITGTNDYSPLTLHFTDYSSATVNIGVGVYNTPDPSLTGTETDYLKRYWHFVKSAGTLSNYTYTADFQYVNSDIVGNESNLRLSRYDGSSWSDYTLTSQVKPGHILSINSSFFKAVDPIVNNDFTGRHVVPTIYYKTINSGDWTDPSIWYTSPDMITWSPATDFPTDFNSMGIDICTGHTVTVSGDISVDRVDSVNGTLIINSGVNFKLSNAANPDMILAGTINNNGVFNNTGIINVLSGATYNHYSDGGVIPTATWDPTSNCNIYSGATSASGLGQSFGNFTYDGGAGNILSLDGNMTVAGNMAISSGTVSQGNFNINLTGSLSGATGTLTQGTGAMTIGGDNTIGTYTCGSGKMDYNGVTQKVKGCTYNKLSISGSGSKTLQAAAIINAKFTLNGGTSFKCSTYNIT